MSEASASRVDAYLHTVEHLEPDIHPIDQASALTSIAISLKRIADAICEATQHQINKDLGR